VVPTRFFLGKPEIGEELTISIEQGKTLTIKLLAVGTLNIDKGTREVFFELNGEVSYRLLISGEARADSADPSCRHPGHQRCYRAR
jgi:pyruvate carboxylase